MSRLFTADFTQLKDIISYIREKLNSFDCDGDTQDTVHVICDEFVTNIISNAYDNDLITRQDIEGNVYARPLQISCNIGSNQICVELVDWGQPFNPLKYCGDSSPERSPGGFGIGIARNLADSIMYNRKDDKNVLTCIVNTRNQK